MAAIRELTIVHRLVAALSPQAVTDVLGPKMDELRQMIKEMHLDQIGNDTAFDVNLMQHTQNLQNTASHFISRQNTLVAHDDDDWMRLSRQDISMSNMSRHGAELNKDSSVSTLPSEEEDPNLDSDEEMEADLTVNLLDGGIESCDQGAYKEAEVTLRNSIQDALRKKLAKTHHDRIKVAQLKLGIACIYQEKFDTAQPILQGIAALPTSPNPEDTANKALSLEALYYLAQISLAYHDFTTALRVAQKCVKDRKRLFGKTSAAYISAVLLLILIYRTSGDHVSAKAYSKQIPPDAQVNYTGIAVLKYSIEGTGLSTAHEAAALKHIKEEFPTDNPFSTHIFRWAASEGHTDIVRLLIPQTANIDEPEWSGGSALGYAARNGHAEILQLLIAHGASITNKARYWDSPLDSAVHGDHVACARLLLDAGAPIDGIETDVVDNWFCMVMNAAYKGANLVLQLLLKHGARADIRNRLHQRTALMYAARESQPRSLEILLQAGAKPDRVDNEGNTALTFAINRSNSSAQMVRALLAHGASPDVPPGAPKGTATPLGAAAKAGDVELLKLLLNAGADVNRHGENGSAPIYFAAGQHAACVKLLLERGAQIEGACKEPRKRTPLNNALDNGKEEICLLLLDAGADTNWWVHEETITPLFMAESRRMGAVMKKLKEKGAIEGLIQEVK